ncbi:MAG: hypothetical protein UT63_C0063G0003 [Candidatus Gottesmanbacteria bacterium GW2011_GWC2_39_8]|uniref:DUF4367 domain-containing protein n=1 Tax=Candidatus Gottesmanbacteria bacterium GW2011_GWC2_39_8 TaxID=1618450 RepID=A0A0G0SAB6_9BACT|nr:MAG: hypothetical protein UT63_C0063G0003 [Candidatus Gottesmanbacteria bacterium GW2011_GWC2_39_8]
MIKIYIKRRLKRYLKKKLLFFIIPVIFIGLIFYEGGRPSIGTVKKFSSGEKGENSQSKLGEYRGELAKKTIFSEEEEKIREGMSVFKGKYFSFPYSNKFELKAHESSGSGILEKGILLGRSVLSEKVVVTVSKQDINSFDDASAIRMRRLKPDLYTEKSVKIDRRSGVLFEKKVNGNEWTAVFLHNGFVSTISVTSIGEKSELEATVNDIIKNIIWL